MVEWLHKQGLFYDKNKTQQAIFIDDIQHVRKLLRKVIKIDTLLSSLGHKVLRLPPYMCILNAIKFVWSQVKHYMRSKNILGTRSLQHLKKCALKFWIVFKVLIGRNTVTMWLQWKKNTGWKVGYWRPPSMRLSYNSEKGKMNHHHQRTWTARLHESVKFSWTSPTGDDYSINMD